MKRTSSISMSLLLVAITLSCTEKAPQAVDLGLSVKWASCNLGATQPEEYGSFYAWGETQEKAEYTWENFKWLDEIRTHDYDDGYEVHFIYINKYESKQDSLQPADDAAHVALGGKWRIPSRKEFKELIDNCIFTWTTVNGINGYKVESKINGNSIFLPAAGGVKKEGFLAGSYGYYWSSDHYKGVYSPCAYILYISDSMVKTDDKEMFYGLSIRPVCP